MELLVFLAGLSMLLSLVVLPILVSMALNQCKRMAQYQDQLQQKIDQLEAKLDGNRYVETRAESAVVEVESSKVIQPEEHTKTVAPIPQPTRHTEPLQPQSITSSPHSAASVIFTTPQKAEEKTTIESDNSEPAGLLTTLFSWLLAGNPLAKLGVLILFFGLAYLIKYSVEREMLSIQFRLMGTAVISSGLLVIGWRLRLKQPLYALILQGGAVGALYLTAFGAFKLYQLLPMALTFGILLIVCASSVALAVLQRAQSLAMLASMGGYLAPILLSSGGGNHIGLFSYYLLLSIGILAITVWQPWRPLNLLGLFFTFGVAGLWGFKYYQPEFYLSSQLFLLINIAIFGVFSVVLSLRGLKLHQQYVDAVLLFVPPLVGFGYQYAITKQWEFGPAFSALGFGFAYFLLAWAGLRRYPALGKQLAISGLALGGVFTTLATPLALSAEWTAIAWSIEGIGVLWLGFYQGQKRVAWSGSTLLLLAAISAAPKFDVGVTLLNVTLVSGLLTLSWLMAAALWRHYSSGKLIAKRISNVFLSGGILFWLIWLMRIIESLALPEEQKTFLFLGLMTLSVVSWYAVAQRLAWSELRLAVWLLWPVMGLILSLQYRDYESLLSLGWLNLLWFPAFGVAYGLLQREAEKMLHPLMKKGLHLFLFWLLLFALSHDVYWYSNQMAWGMNSWKIFAQCLFIALIVVSVDWLVRQPHLLFAKPKSLYQIIALLPLMPWALLLLLTGNLNDGTSFNWYYLPILNPLEIGIGLVLASLLLWTQSLIRWITRYQVEVQRAFTITAIVLLVWWGNGLLLRVLAHYGDIAWSGQALWHSRLVQTTLALIWTLIALMSMVLAARHHHRRAWFGGATLLGVVMIKLFAVDSAHGGGLARAIAFIGVAILLLAIGYFSPLPPRQNESVPNDEQANKFNNKEIA